MNNKLIEEHFDKLAHILLFSGLILGGMAVYTYRNDAQVQFLAIALTVAFYVSWGFVFHHIKGDLVKKLVFEYLALGVIALAAAVLVFLK